MARIGLLKSGGTAMKTMFTSRPEVVVIGKSSMAYISHFEIVTFLLKLVDTTDMYPMPMRTTEKTFGMWTMSSRVCSNTSKSKNAPELQIACCGS